MSKEYDNIGVLFKNDRKTEPKHPDYKGTELIGGKKFWLSSWLKVGNNGCKFLSLSFTPVEDRPQERRPPAALPDPDSPRTVPEDDMRREIKDLEQQISVAGLNS